METLILTTSEEDIERAAEILKAGGLVAFPTETVYGLGANALDPDAVKRVYLAKGRPSDNPMIVHIGEKAGLAQLTDLMTRDMELLMDAVWPGPMTMVVPAKDIVPRVTTGGLDTVAVRMPSDEVARKLIIRSGLPIAAPSANLSGHPSPTTYRHCIDDLMGRVDAIICGADCQVGIESTVIDMTGGDDRPPVILRPGIVTAERIGEIIGKEVSLDPSLLKRPEIDKNTGNPVTGEDFKPRSPGMKYKHYAPKAEMTIFRGPHEEVLKVIEARRAQFEAQGRKVTVITYSDSEQETAAREFFARLRECDKDGTDVILASALKEEGVGFSVMNRMFKSAGYNVEDVKEEKTMKIAIASDHGGFQLKEKIREYLAENHLELEVADLGTYNEESVDYPLYGKLCGETVVSGKADLGIVCCGTGIGISIAANKVKGIRCALVTSVEMAHLAKEHNNANILALGGRTTTPELAFEMIEEWLGTEFGGGRHKRRTDLLDEM
ncbi:MAG: threonylcarbamoyl-AMP synthase [Firmicutes bacterium]|nr:threonylcarbamoyl-AMP synthase [Bacillota bacterium]